MRLATGAFVEFVGVKKIEADSEATADAPVAADAASAGPDESQSAESNPGSYELTVLFRVGELKGSTRTITDLSELQWLAGHSPRWRIGARVLCKEGSGCISGVRVSDAELEYDVTIKAGRQAGDIVVKSHKVRTAHLPADHCE